MKQDKILIGLLALAVALVIFNQVLIMQVSELGGQGGKRKQVDFSKVDIDQIKSTGQSVAAFFPVQDIKTSQDAVDIMIPTGTPDYGPSLGITYDDPVQGLDVLVNVDRTIQLTPEENQRYVSLVTKPVGISCEYCCGVGPVGVDRNGKSICGCQHNPALLGLTKWLIQNTDYSDEEIIQEALRWKTLFFPKDMVNLAVKVSGGDATVDELPGMVGGC